MIPNGVAVAAVRRRLAAAGLPARAGGTIGFLGRYDEPRKGMPVLLEALARLAADRPDLRLLVAGRGDAEELLADLPPALAGRVDLLGRSARPTRRGCCARSTSTARPTPAGESFGVILLEAMAAGVPIVASDLDAFRRVLDDGRAGVLFRTGDPAALADSLAALLDDPARRARLTAVGTEVVAPYDWPVVARQIVAVYETVVAADPVVVRPDTSASPRSRRRVSGRPTLITRGGDARRGRRGRLPLRLGDAGPSTRLDRLHGRIDAARAALDARWSAAPPRCRRSPRTRTPPSGRRARPGCSSWPGRRWTPTRAPARRPRTTCPGPCATSPAGADPGAAGATCTDAARRVALARRFYNDAVRDTVLLRRRRLPRLLRLGGAQPLPAFFEIDDTVPVPAPQRTQR